MCGLDARPPFCRYAATPCRRHHAQGECIAVEREAVLDSNDARGFESTRHSSSQDNETGTGKTQRYRGKCFVLFHEDMYEINDMTKKRIFAERVLCEALMT